MSTPAPEPHTAPAQPVPAPATAPPSTPQDNAHTPVNTYALVSLILAVITPALIFTFLPAIIIGKEAEKQITATGENGRILARLGVAFGWAFAIFYIAAITILLAAFTASLVNGAPVTTLTPGAA